MKNCTNSRYHNSGDLNSGNYNSGYRNSGNYNSGYYNSGDSNSGGFNSNNHNSGFYNSGHHNTGNRNSGNYNSGSCNSGYRNSGNFNSGDHNSGDFNLSSNSSGCFNTKTQKLRFFDKETDITLDEWRRTDAYRLLCRVDLNPVKWVEVEEMSGIEKIKHLKYKTVGGYLKEVDISDAYNKWWDSLTQKEKQIIKDIPNFDEDKFSQITGIRVNDMCNKRIKKED